MNWLREHWRALLSAWARIRIAPGGFAFNVVVIALALVLPLTGLTVMENLRPVARDLAVEEIAQRLYSNLNSANK